MRHEYFISLEFSNNDVNKFLYTIRPVDIETTDLVDFAKECISLSFPAIDLDTITIRINAFNRV